MLRPKNPALGIPVFLVKILFLVKVVKSRETRKTLEKRGRGGRKEGENAEGGGVGLGCWVASVTGWVWGVVGSLNPRKAQKNALSPPGLRLLVVGLAGTGNPGFRSAGVGACY